MCSQVSFILSTGGIGYPRYQVPSGGIGYLCHAPSGMGRVSRGWYILNPPLLGVEDTSAVGTHPTGIVKEYTSSFYHRRYRLHCYYQLDLRRSVSSLDNYILGQDSLCLNYHPRRSCGKVMFYTCLSFCPWGDVWQTHPPRQTPPGRHPPGRHLPADTLPLGQTHSLGRHTPW